MILAGWANAIDVGSISELRGNGEVIRQGSNDKLLAELALGISSYDDVRTGNGRIAIEFLDSSVVRLTEHSKLVIDDFVYDPAPNKSKLALNMASGTARFITGRLSGIKKENIFIKTPSATIGIRGTDFTTTVDELGRSLVILLPDASGNSSGSISVTTWSGTEILDQPFQATMVSTFESRPTKAVVLGNISLDLIDNMLIVNKPPAIVEAEAEQQGETSSDLDRDFFEDAPDLDKDFLEEEEEITRLDIDLLSFDFLVDLLAVMETSSKKKTEVVNEMDGIEIAGILPGFDPVLQTYTFIEGEHLFFVHQGTNTFDIAIGKYKSTSLRINSVETIMDVEVNGVGDNSIIIFQSP